MKPVALFSLHDTSQAVRFAQELINLGWCILASQETIDLLEAQKLPCTNIADYCGVKAAYGFPPTLHPRVEHALTQEDSSDRIDLVYVIPYPLSIGNDVGGRTLLALAAKGRRLPIMSHEDMQHVLDILKSGKTVSEKIRQTLIEKTYAEISSHYLNLVSQTDLGNFTGMISSRHYELANGENPYQQATLFGLGEDDTLALTQFENLSETPPCYTNLADTDSVINTMCLASDAFHLKYDRQPFLCVSAKHGNPCGMAVSWERKAEVIERTLFGNPMAVWGGELIVNFEIDEMLAETLVRHPKREELLGSAAWMLDVVIAPDFSSGASERLLKRKLRKVFRNPNLSHPHLPTHPYSYRWVRGGVIRQSPPWRSLKFGELDFVNPVDNKWQPEPADSDNLIITWSVAYTSFHGGNEIALAKDGFLIGVGGGPSTVQAAQVAVERALQAGHDVKNSIFCADAFFPFTDATQVLIDAGVKMGCVPAGGKNEPLVRKQLAEAGIPMVYLPEDFRGFCRH
jgi:phosphoribosylaminoimidazolecarboxamide formyltransferase/IMP cyclohydrolase